MDAEKWEPGYKGYGCTGKTTGLSMPGERDISLAPIGQVECAVKATAEKMPGGWPGVIRVRPEYSEGLLRIGEYTHLWVLCWFHESRRDLLRVRPCRMDSALPEYGVFGLRCPVRPNPVSLTTVRLEKVEENLLYVSGLDAIHGTFVLDIKPYYGGDVILSAKGPYLRPASGEMRRDIFTKAALAHHGEWCPGALAAVRMALVAEEHFGSLQQDELTVAVRGSACLADVIQGLTRARLAHPSRFCYLGDGAEGEVTWLAGGKGMKMSLLPGAMEEGGEFRRDDELFQVTKVGE